MHGNELGMAVLFWLLNYWWLWIPAILLAFVLAVRWAWKKLTTPEPEMPNDRVKIEDARTEFEARFSTGVSEVDGRNFRRHSTDASRYQEDRIDAIWLGWQAALSTPTRQAGDGWRLVPVEPTERMVVEGFESRPDEHFSAPEVWAEYEAMSGCQQAAHRARLCWAAMLAAAPQAPQGGGGEVV